MQNIGTLVCVLGNGQLAAAVRAQLHLAALAQANDDTSDCSRNRPALFLACSDFENASLCAALGQRVLRDGASALFACITGEVLRVGPLVSASNLGDFLETCLARSWDFSLNGIHEVIVPTRDALMPNADSRKTRVALIGARVVVGELAKVLFAAQLVARVAENESPSREGEPGSCASPASASPASTSFGGLPGESWVGAPGATLNETFSETTGETFVARRGRSPSVWARLARARHPAAIG